MKGNGLLCDIRGAQEEMVNFRCYILVSSFTEPSLPSQKINLKIDNNVINIKKKTIKE